MIQERIIRITNCSVCENHFIVRISERHIERFACVNNVLQAGQNVKRHAGEWLMIEEAENDLGDGAAILLLKLGDSLGDFQVAGVK